MTQSLKVNEKEYLPSSTLARNFNYTSDYISKLARDEKVLGTRIGRQWFIEPESLRTYIQQLEVEKRINKEALSQQRKLERQVIAGKTVKRAKASRASRGGFVAAGQALAVLSCGLIVGIMSLSVYSFGLKPTDIAGGFEYVSKEMATPLVQGFSSFVELASRKPSPVANSLTGTSETSVVVLMGIGPQFQRGRYTDFPEVADRLIVSSTTTEETELVKSTPSSELDLLFSDEVELVPVNSELRVRPIFRGSNGDTYELSAILVPAEDQR